MSKEITFSLSRKAMIELWWLERKLKFHKIPVCLGREDRPTIFKLIKNLIKPPKLGGLFG